MGLFLRTDTKSSRAKSFRTPLQQRCLSQACSSVKPYHFGKGWLCQVGTSLHNTMESVSQSSGYSLCHQDRLRPFQMSSPAWGPGLCWLGCGCSMLGAQALSLVWREGTQEGLALLLQIKRMTWIRGLSSLTASFKLLILKQDKQRINNLAEHRERSSSQSKGKPLQNPSPAAE